MLCYSCQDDIWYIYESRSLVGPTIIFRHSDWDLIPPSTLSKWGLGLFLHVYPEIIPTIHTSWLPLATWLSGSQWVAWLCNWIEKSSTFMYTFVNRNKHLISHKIIKIILLHSTHFFLAYIVGLDPGETWPTHYRHPFHKLQDDRAQTSQCRKMILNSINFYE